MSKIVRERKYGKIIWILVFTAVSVFCLIFFAAKGRFETPMANKTVMMALAPFQRAAAWASSGIGHIIVECQDILQVHEQNKQLRDEVEQLRAQNVRANEYAEENIRLRSLLGYKTSATQFDLLPAHVIGREAATWTSTIVIDRGSNDGIKNEMAVVTDRGLVGCVSETAPNSARVELITDPRIAVGTLVQRSRVAGIVEGSLNDAEHPRMVNLPLSVDVTNGDTIITSGLRSIYPKGLSIGIVKEVKNDEGGLLKYAVIETTVDFQKLENVLVITASRETPGEMIEKMAASGEKQIGAGAVKW